jgi:hypothetical protein
MNRVRSAMDGYLEQQGIRLDIVFDTDLGELVRGHHVVARGIYLGRPTDLHKWQADMEAAPWRAPMTVGSQRDWTVVGTHPPMAELFYEFIPGLKSWEEDIEPNFWYWMLHTSDDQGTVYSDANNGTRQEPNGGPATHATRDLGGHLPAGASRLVIDIEPPRRWKPPEPWRRQLVIDLQHHQLIESL